jgi:hypothetical protein
VAVHLGQAKHVGYRNPRTGVLHPLKLSLSPGPDWEPLYTLATDRQHDLDLALHKAREEIIRLRALTSELDDQVAGSQARLAEWQKKANDQATHVRQLQSLAVMLYRGLHDGPVDGIPWLTSEARTLLVDTLRTRHPNLDLTTREGHVTDG